MKIKPAKITKTRATPPPAKLRRKTGIHRKSAYTRQLAAMLKLQADSEKHCVLAG
jgi:hypothetical protein